jgi:hypothetical protein
MSNYTINPDALEEACGIYGLHFPVRVRLLDGGPMGMLGKYHGIGRYGPTTDDELAEPAHHISLKSDLGVFTANTALWHELTHAMQCERFLPEDLDNYRAANRGLTMAFRQEMKEVRRKAGTTSKALTAAYSNVSFEKEAHDSTDIAKKIDLILPGENAKEDDFELLRLLDDKGRALWRIDLWKSAKWEKGNKVREKEFRGTYYVRAAKEWEAKQFAKKEWGESSDDSKGYLCRPLEGGK